MRTLDSIGNNPVTIISGLDSETPAGLGRIAKGNAFYAAVKQSKSTHALIVGDTIYLSDDAGISLAIQVEAYYKDAPFTGFVIIPMDNQVYTIEMEDGLEFGETISSKAEMLKSIDPTKKWVCPEALITDEYTEAGVKPIDLVIEWENSPATTLKTIRREFYAHGLFLIPASILPCLLIAVTAGCLFAGNYYYSHLRAAAQRGAAVIEERVEVTRAPVPNRAQAHEALQHLARVMDDLTAYRANGLTTVMVKGHTIVLTGDILYPSNHQRLEDIATERGDEIVIAVTSWSVEAPWLLDGLGEAQELPVIFEAIRSLQDEMSRYGIKVNLEQQLFQEPLTSVTTTMSIEQPTEDLLRRIAKYFSTRPAELSLAVIHYEDKLPSRADLTFTLTGD